MGERPHRRRSRIGARLAGLWFLVSVALLVWPVYPWLGNHVHPRVLGLPWSLVWVLLVIAANFGALLLLYRLRVVDDREHDDPPSRDPEPVASTGSRRRVDR
ncbi:MAG: hypothetical protein H6712_03730 [Myxococcales bacterium]|nr:hypothetical protein [Myxococcales bacterium]MCB9712936.1 hypothetical protein [Myxococcales bacterium]